MAARYCFNAYLIARVVFAAFFFIPLFGWVWRNVSWYYGHSLGLGENEHLIVGAFVYIILLLIVYAIVWLVDRICEACCNMCCGCCCRPEDDDAALEEQRALTRPPRAPRPMTRIEYQQQVYSERGRTR